MVNKAMIINGVDVINCKFLEMPYVNPDIYCRLGLLDLKNTQEALQCKNCPNCYYKQLKKLEDKLQLRMASDKESDAFWDEIFSEKDYPFNKENAYKELQDYYFVLEQLPKIYMEITGGTLSKTTYFASSVVEAYNDALDRYYQEIDDLEYKNNEYKSALENIKEIAEPIYEQIPDDKVLRQILLKISEVLK